MATGSPYSKKSPPVQAEWAFLLGFNKDSPDRKVGGENIEADRVGKTMSGAKEENHGR